MSSKPVEAGIRTAILGTVFLLLLTMLISFPLGVGAAIYLEEYKSDKPFDERVPAGRWTNNAIQRVAGLIETNIYNLSGVPSIIYGILGLAIFVRALEQFTSGAIFGYADPTTANGRTIMSAALTMSLLVLPVVIISSQEAIRAVPSSLRQASYGLGATKWQTVWKIVLPNALPGILTGTILSISRAIGETAPLIVIGASTFIVTDPDSLFSKFTVLPLQIYNWTSRPQEEFRAIAAAAIIILLVLLLSLNAAAIWLRNYLRSKRVST
jgi:phosphate transport system permease protein